MIKIVFDKEPSNLHFNNGYIDLKTSEFKNRKIGENYISKTTGYNYNKSLKQDRKK